LDFLSTQSWSREDIDRLLASAALYRAGGGRTHERTIVGLAFFEESLRTRVGFETAAARLGARVTTVTSAKRSPSMGLAEADLDALLSIEGWLDVLCLRHPSAEFAGLTARGVNVPVINCGNGSDEHPTQALIDLLAIADVTGGVDGVRIALVGDLAGMRTAHSLAAVLSRCCGVTLHCIAPRGLELPARFVTALQASGNRVEVLEELDLSDADVVYLTGLPKVTGIGVVDDELRSRFQVTAQKLTQAGGSLTVLCPLPRVDEITRDVDPTPAAGYFAQSRSGLWMRMAVLDEVLSAAG
jgi:aspartate carbamoyltransferase catalytic subunit